ncbi:hypothetical protein HN51_061774 [Arachis hypogaea]|uniref:Uncharacterized protein n=1 Tax=Arachis hypogaea TaxID=3818 RepID=A0A445APQ0_ARAHY|nr:uncharacterized protein LOC107625861 [Arachis ipaensis]XP_025627078.1 uncharacterized protein LOC112720371 [Arachis hypogaea]QHO19099.1 uncharacterized protein DS421_11g325990 [Arachis hypogaea]RYR28401.1 hypothetical protein Ahy_B01g052513 [Arachis hypogaea]
MGNCFCVSLDSQQMEVEVEVETAKLIVHDGRFQEFPYTVKVSYLLQLYQGCFVCNSDDMEFDGVIRAVRETEVLKLGQLYFVLPLNRLNRILKPEEMAALAVMAASAIAKSGFGHRPKQVVFFAGDENGKNCRKVAPDVPDFGGTGGGQPLKMVRRGKGGGGGDRHSDGNKGRKFETVLSVIPE